MPATRQDLVTAPSIRFDLSALDALLTGLPGDFPPALYHMLGHLRDRLADYHRLAGASVPRGELAALYNAIVAPLDEVQTQARERVLSAAMEAWCHETNRQMVPLREAVTGEATDNLAFDDDESWDA